jgi:hypothetical protein
MGEVQCPLMDQTSDIDMLREYAVRLKEMVVQTQAASLLPRYTDACRKLEGVMETVDRGNWEPLKGCFRFAPALLRCIDTAGK